MSAFVDKTMFMAYAKSTWDMSNRHANRLIAASCVIDKVRPRGRVLKRIASRSGTSHAERPSTVGRAYVS